MTRFSLGFGLALVTVIAYGQPPPAPPPRAIPVAEWVRQLGNPDPHERDAATARLSALTVRPPPELLAATRSDDPQVRVRATRAVAAIRTSVALARGRRFAEQGRVDLFVAATAAWDLPADDPRLWEPVFVLGQSLTNKTEFPRDSRPHNCPSWYPDIATYKKLLGPVFTRTDRAYVQPDPQRAIPPVLYRNESIQSPGVHSATGLFGGLIVSRGDVETLTAIQTSIILATGDVTAVSAIGDCVVVCDGDVAVTGRSISGSVVVARGNITMQGWPYKSYLAAGGKVTRGMKPKNVTDRNVVQEGAKGALGVRFFELSDVGLVVRAAGGAVAVESITAGGACDRAGVRAGDVIVTVNGRRPESAESLRRLLRDALGPGDAAVSLRRGADTVAVTVALPD